MCEMTDAELFQMLADLRDLNQLNAAMEHTRQIMDLVERCAPITELLEAVGIPEDFYAEAR